MHGHDVLEFAVFQAALAALYLGLYHFISFELAVIVALANITMALARV